MAIKISGYGTILPDSGDAGFAKLQAKNSSSDEYVLFADSSISFQGTVSGYTSGGQSTPSISFHSLLIPMQQMLEI
jgi:hypothetical protein